MAPLYDGSSGRNMDGGWGWVVVGASFILRVVTNGSSFSFGLIFVELLAEFKAGEAVTSYIGSLQASLMCLTGFFVGPFGKAMGWRPMSIAGGIISGIGFGASALAPNIYVLYLTCGVLTGIGNGFMYASLLMCFHSYFDKYRTIASGIISSGSGLGQLAYSLLANYLLTHYNWRITFAIYSAIAIVVGISCGLLLKPPPPKSNESNSVLNIDEEAKDESIETSQSHNKSRTEKKKLFYGSIEDSYIDSPETHSNVECNQETEHTPIMVYLTLSSKQTESQPKGAILCSKLKGVGQAMKNKLDFSLLTNPIKCLFAASIFSFSFGYHVVYTYSPERALRFGLSRTKASSLISVIAISNIVFRLVTGFIGDKFPGFRFYLVGLAFLSMGVLGMMISLFDSYPAMLAYMVMYALALGTVPSILPVVLLDTLGVDNIEKSLGIWTMFLGIGFMLASPMAGLIIQKSGDINLPFEVLGFIGVLGAIAYFFILCLIPKYGVKSEKLKLDTGKI